MNFQNTKKDLKVVISVGDESGIGPEIILKALCSNEISDNIEFVLVGSKRNLQNTYKHLRSQGLENLAMTGKIVGKRSRGKQRRQYLDQIKEWTGLTQTEVLLREANSRTLQTVNVY